MDPDKERAKRLRDRRIAERHPGESKIKGYDWARHAAKPKPKQKPFLIELFDIMPGRWKGAAMGVAFGAILGLILMLVVSEELRALALLPILMCGMGGMVIGKLMQDDSLLN